MALCICIWGRCIKITRCLGLRPGTRALPPWNHSLRNFFQGICSFSNSCCTALKRLAESDSPFNRYFREAEQKLSHLPASAPPTLYQVACWFSQGREGARGGGNWPVQHTSCTERPASPLGYSKYSMSASATWSPSLQSTGAKTCTPFSRGPFQAWAHTHHECWR